MLESVESIRKRLSDVLQRLLDDVLALSEGKQSLEFGDEQEYLNILGQPFGEGVVACLIPGSKRLIICLRQLNSIGRDEELTITHELGHVYLTYNNFPRIKRETDSSRQEAIDICFSPLFDIMEHAILYPWLKLNYNFDLYNIGNQRLHDFIKTDLPKRKINSQGDEVSLILYYLKYNIEVDDKYWQGRLNQAYSRKFANCQKIAEESLAIIKGLGNTSPDAKLFLTKYYEVLRILNISQNLWPSMVLVL